MRSLALATAALAAGVSLLAESQQVQPPPQQQQQQAPVFKSGVDVIRLDVTVIDKDRKPVRNLLAENFTVLENGKPQRIVAVNEMAASEQDPTPSAWMRMVTPDVAAN